jgi:hypothetical protein
MGSSKDISEEQDVAELRRNLATGNQKDAGDASSASELRLLNASRAACSILHDVQSLLLYAIA